MNDVKTDYKCFIVDDNKIDRLTTVSLVRKYPFLKIDGIFESAPDALDAADKNLPDVIFLDIDMPEICGLDLRTKLEKVPACIFITAYPDYAVPGFEVNALDFLLKPVSLERFDMTMKRLQYFLNIHFLAGLQEHAADNGSIYIKEGREHIKIRFSDIIYLEALKDYTGIVTKERKYCILTPLGNLLREKNFINFIRIHRSYAVQQHMIRKVNSTELTVDTITLPVGRSFREVLNSLLTK